MAKDKKLDSTLKVLYHEIENLKRTIMFYNSSDSLSDYTHAREVCKNLKMLTIQIHTALWQERYARRKDNGEPNSGEAKRMKAWRKLTEKSITRHRLHNEALAQQKAEIEAQKMKDGLK
jgi:predicted glycoside hydrolase/deacetylase ChbG (UPF0249 family)